MTRTRRSAAQHGLVERRIRFKVHQRRHHDRWIIVALPRTELIDTRRAAGIVALRAGVPLEDVRIVSIGNP
jgi:hypothetical protein